MLPKSGDPTAMKLKRTPIRQRVITALWDGALTYDQLAQRVFPPRENPQAWRCAAQGGPPGCFMALSRTLRELGCQQSFVGPGPGQRHVTLPTAIRYGLRFR